MKQQIMSIFTRTPLHVGAGSAVGVVDLPVMRERHTGYPVIPGSSLKGVLADLWRDDLDCVVNRYVLYYANVKKGCRKNGECIRTT